MTATLETTEGGRRRASIHHLFESPTRSSADSRKTGQQLIATWEDIEARLSALIGPRGVEALFSRSLHLAGRISKCLVGLDQSPSGRSVTFGDVAARLSTIEPAPAREASLLLLLSFTDLLSSLVGDSLTDRLLGPVWANPASLPTTAPNDEEKPHE